jgi:hypothetical protein
MEDCSRISGRGKQLFEKLAASDKAMVKQEFDINSLRIASPCPVGWETMKGDERTRHCGLCSLNVYNFSEMTAAEVESLVRRSGGRVCARMFRRSDGTVITRDCPVGLAAYRKRVSRFAGAALAMILGLFSAGYGQSQESKEKKVVTAAELNINKKPGVKGETRLYGAVLDTNGDVIPGVSVKLVTTDRKNIRTATTNDEGVFSFPGPRAGSYNIEIEPKNGFNGILIKDLEIEAGTLNELNISLEAAPVTVTVGIMAEMPTGTEINTDSKMVLGRLLMIPPSQPKKP